MKKIFIASALVVASLLPGVASAQTDNVSSADKRPQLSVAVADVPPTLEPAQELSNQGVRITYSMFDTLIRRDFLSSPNGDGSKLVPSLAESWKRIDDRTLEVKLRPNVKFHNGETMTADDVVFTFSPERLTGRDAPLKQGRAYFGVLEKVEAIDPLTVRFTTKTADPILEQRLASWAAWIVNKKDWTEHANGKFPKFPVGTGPFKLAEYKPDESVRLVAFDDYFDGRPTAASVTFRVVPEQATRIAGLVSGEFDIATNIAPDQIQQIDSYPDIEARSVVLANAHVLVYNTENPAIKDKRIRQAMNLAIDRKLLVEALWNGQAVIPKSHQFPEFGALYDEKRTGLVYDPEKARQLLKEAGYKGEEVRYSTRANYYLNALPAAQAIMEMWKAAGINGKLDIVESTDNIPSDVRMVRTWSNSIRYPDPAGGLWNLWGPFGGVQQNKDWLPVAFNKLGEELDRTADTAKRREIFQKMLDIWEDEAPGTILYQPLETYGVRKSVKWQPYNFYYMDLRPYNLTFEAKRS
ncbi:peptide/nickel transport system substrate-binding protein [Xaviernesmea oryzae]|uniref:Peptide/nickel transport system substrate-binding protein n=1 Tax=Xaviernesmea oryzae TaxID=464029 RepID=A0A1X7FUF9_9HYPH|nr:ABC transporter substrate-binding protein [Xaviernesmea oryzae]SMF58956.1 peptide/nickel transport system substrate-binding protein [Xaviernesmea oryzae]